MKTIIITMALFLGFVGVARAISTPSCPDGQVYQGEYVETTTYEWQCKIRIKGVCILWKKVPVTTIGDVMESSEQDFSFCNDSLIRWAITREIKT